MVVGKKILEQESFEEPSCVREVPLGGTDFRYGLQTVIVRRQRLAQRLAHAPHAAVSCRQRLPIEDVTLFHAPSLAGAPQHVVESFSLIVMRRRATVM